MGHKTKGKNALRSRREQALKGLRSALARWESLEGRGNTEDAKLRTRKMSNLQRMIEGTVFNLEERR